MIIEGDTVLSQTLLPLSLKYDFLENCETCVLSTRLLSSQKTTYKAPINMRKN